MSRPARSPVSSSRVRFAGPAQAALSALSAVVGFATATVAARPSLAADQSPDARAESRAPERSAIRASDARSQDAVSEGATKIPFSFQDAEVGDVVTAYAKASGATFVMASVRGKASIVAPGPVTLDQAFALMSTALAENGFAIVRQGGAYVVEHARDVQTSGHEVVAELPAPAPERMVTLIVELKHAQADEVTKQLLRVLPSKNGSMTPVPSSNRLVLTDFVSNLQRIRKVLDEIDQPPRKAAAVAKARRAGDAKPSSGEAKR